jgi:hypothetical protein
MAGGIASRMSRTARLDRAVWDNALNSFRDSFRGS